MQKPTANNCVNVNFNLRHSLRLILVLSSNQISNRWYTRGEQRHQGVVLISAQWLHLNLLLSQPAIATPQLDQPASLAATWTLRLQPGDRSASPGTGPGAATNGSFH